MSDPTAIRKWTPIQEGRFYLRSMRDRGMSPLEYFRWMVEQKIVKDTARNRKRFTRCLDLAAKESVIEPGSVVIVPSGESKAPWEALVVSVSGGGTFMARTRRCPTKAEVERGDYDPWVKTARRFSLDDVIRIESVPTHAEGGVA